MGCNGGTAVMAEGDLTWAVGSQEEIDGQDGSMQCCGCAMGKNEQGARCNEGR